MSPNRQRGFLLFNTLSKTKEPFRPIDPTRVRMYACGPTVYDLIHIGNARPAIVYDVLYRLLNYVYGRGNVLYVRNITDVDDKIIQRAKELNVSSQELASNTIKEFRKDEEYLGCLKPDAEPQVTNHIQTIIEVIEKLLQNKAAYVSDGNVFFSVKKAEGFYTNLAGRRLEELLSKQEHNPFKREPNDFALWKPKREDEIEAFSSPWGLGRPGWHIECSAMSTKLLGHTFDIHGGGVDLIFPHHTNEIAQSLCAFPDSSYAKFWVHTGFLTSNKEKMSKSLGNFVTVRNLKESGISGKTLRIFILNTHYRKPLDFSSKALEDAQITANIIDRALTICKDTTPEESLPEEFFNYLADDLNTHMCLDYLHRLALHIHNGKAAHAQSNFLSCCNILGLLSKESELEKVQGRAATNVCTVEKLVAQRAVARANKDWELADKIRSELSLLGVQLKDNSDGSTSWE